MHSSRDVNDRQHYEDNKRCHKDNYCISYTCFTSLDQIIGSISNEQPGPSGSSDPGPSGTVSLAVGPAAMLAIIPTREPAVKKLPVNCKLLEQALMVSTACESILAHLR